MTEVYIDVAAATVEAPAGEAVAGGDALTAEPEAVRALRYLADAGIRVVLVTGGGAEPPDDLRRVSAGVVSAVPSEPHGRAWYLTNDIARCGGASARLQTMLIGGNPPAGSVRRCDAVVRDVQAGAIEILAALAMPPNADTAH